MTSMTPSRGLGSSRCESSSTCTTTRTLGIASCGSPTPTATRWSWPRRMAKNLWRHSLYDGGCAVDPREEARLIEAARGGDERSFQRLIAQQRASLQAHCYRLLGSVADADDALQETLLGAWQGIRGFEGRSTLRSWLFVIATHACMRL